MNYNKMLIDSAYKGDLGGVISALEHGADVNLRNKDGDTALILAALNGHTAVVKTLIDAGADLDINNNDSKAALDLSLEKEHHDIAKLIKSHIEKQVERQEYVFDLNI